MKTKLALFQHRHYVAIAAVIAALPEQERANVANHFADKLAGTNQKFDRGRFVAAAVGAPVNGRDK